MSDPAVKEDAGLHTRCHNEFNLILTRHSVSTFLFIYLFFHLFFIYLWIYLFIYWLIDLFIDWFYWLIYLFIDLVNDLFIELFIGLFIYLFIYRNGMFGTETVKRANDNCSPLSHVPRKSVFPYIAHNYITALISVVSWFCFRSANSHGSSEYRMSQNSVPFFIWLNSIYEMLIVKAEKKLKLPEKKVTKSSWSNEE